MDMLPSQTALAGNVGCKSPPNLNQIKLKDTAMELFIAAAIIAAFVITTKHKPPKGGLLA